MKQTYRPTPRNYPVVHTSSTAASDYLGLSGALATSTRPVVRGKFLYAGNRKLYLRGVTYGTFKPNSAGDLFPEPSVAARDFALMADHGINSLRTYTVPPRWLLDLAQAHGLRVLVGIP